MAESKRMGRPVVGEAKNNKFQVRLTDSQLKKLNTCAEMLGKSKTDVINLGIDRVYESLK